jgi:hypothetical protein
VTLVDLLWAPPLVLAISVALGAAGRQHAAEIHPRIRQSFVALMVGLAMVGVIIRAAVLLFA